MKVVAINGSPKKEGNTYHALKLVAEELEKEGIEVEIIHVGGQVISGCTGCGYCARTKNERCVIENDDVNTWIQSMKAADGILLGSPVHFSAIGGTMKSFLDRVFYVASSGLFRHKVGASVVAVRRSGGVQIMRVLGKNMAWLMKLVENGAGTVSEPDREPKQFMNFIR